MAQQKAVDAPVEDLEDLVDELQPGTKLLKGQYTIVRYINSGGFGITYLAKDSLDRNVVIKECFPSAFCRRSKAVVAARSRAHTAELRSVVQLFVREARNLSKIVHPNIVSVHQVFEDNGTAYMALDFIDGLDLQQIIDGQGTMPDTEQVVLMTEKLLAAVGFIHARDMLHRDISPDNVLIDPKGNPVLIDFGAAREQASQTNRAMSALRVVKDGYSPQEFYIAGSEQGPWSDLYALGATLYHLISGEAAANGQARLASLAEDKPDPYLPLAGRFPGYPPGFLEAIDKAMQTLPKNRVQSAQEWLSMFRPGVVVPVEESDDIAMAVRAMVESSRAEAVTLAEPAPAPVAGTPAPAEAAPALAAEGAPSPEPVSRQVSQRPAPAAAPLVGGRSGFPVQIAGGIALALALIGGGYLLLAPGENPTPAPDAAVAEGQAPATAPATSDTAEAAPAADAASDAPATPDAPPAETAATTVEATPEPLPAEPAPEAAPAATAEATAPEAAPEAASEPDPAPAATAEAEPEPQPEAQPATAADPAPADPTPAATAPAATPRANQIAFAAWDVTLPFIEENRIIGGQRVAIVARVLPTTDIAVSGTWLANGLLLYSVNGVDIQQSGTVIAAVLNAMQVDPDGRARVVVEYAGSTLERQTGLLTVDARRLVSLAAGVNVAISAADGEWQAVVTGVTRPEATSLRQGDILFRDRTTGIALSGPGELERIMAALVEQGAPATEFAIIRDNQLGTATLQLLLEAPE
jgi:hypothetical protein